MNIKWEGKSDLKDSNIKQKSRLNKYSIFWRMILFPPWHFQLLEAYSELNSPQENLNNYNLRWSTTSGGRK